MARSKSSSKSAVTNPDARSGNENAKWTSEDEKAFVGFLTDHVAERGDGNYKKSTFNAAAAFLETMRTVGGAKTGQVCKNKWARIKEIYLVCYKLKNNVGTSGFTWSEEKGANIGIEDLPVWEAYVRKNPKAAQFKDKGWPLYNTVDAIVPDKAKGKYLFAPSQATAPDPSSVATPEGSPDPDHDSDAASDAADNEDPNEAASSASQDHGGSQDLSASPSYSPPPPPPAPSSGRKRSALEMSGSSVHAKSGSTPQRLPRDTAVSRSIDRMSEVLAGFVAAPTGSDDSSDVALESTPKRRRIAVELAAKQEDEELSDNDMVELIEVMRRDITAADTYLSLSKASDRLRRTWVRKVLEHRY